jgi:hypothetical protein
MGQGPHRARHWRGPFYEMVMEMMEMMEVKEVEEVKDVKGTLRLAFLHAGHLAQAGLKLGQARKYIS